MNMSVEDARRALTVLQLTQLATSLIEIAVNAVRAGRDQIPAEEVEERLTTAFAEKDAALAEQAAAITRARTEGR